MAEAINAQAGAVVDNDADDDEEQTELPDEDCDQILDIIEAMAAHWESETHESIMRWSWRLFCAKWARLYDYLLAERQRERKRKRKQAREKEHRDEQAWFAQAGR